MTQNTEIVDITNAEHYTWGDNCDGWHLVKSGNLSVIRETMPPMTKEKLHYHARAQQFFYIIAGMATFEINGTVFNVSQSQGIRVEPGARHRISNNTGSALEFIVISEPKSHGDRVNIDDM